MSLSADVIQYERRRRQDAEKGSSALAAGPS